MEGDALVATGVAALDAVDNAYKEWDISVHLVSDILDLTTFVVWLWDADVLENDYLEDPAAYVIVIGFLVPVIGWLLESQWGVDRDRARKLYIGAEVIFDTAEVVFVTIAKQNGKVKDREFIKGGLDQRGLGLHLQNMHCSTSLYSVASSKTY